jgi:hypothetical protein
MLRCASWQVAEGAAAACGAAAKGRAMGAGLRCEGRRRCKRLCRCAAEWAAGGAGGWAFDLRAPRLRCSVWRGAEPSSGACSAGIKLGAM